MDRFQNHVDDPYNFYQNKTQAQPDTAYEKIGFKAQFDLEQGIADYVKILENR